MQQTRSVGLGLATMLLVAACATQSTSTPSGAATPVLATPSASPSPTARVPNAELTAALDGRFTGTTIDVFGPWVEAEGSSFDESLDAFRDATGINVLYSGNRQLRDRTRRDAWMAVSPRTSRRSDNRVACGPTRRTTSWSPLTDVLDAAALAASLNPSFDRPCDRRWRPLRPLLHAGRRVDRLVPGQGLRGQGVHDPDDVGWSSSPSATGSSPTAAAHGARPWSTATRPVGSRRIGWKTSSCAQPVSTCTTGGSLMRSRSTIRRSSLRPSRCGRCGSPRTTYSVARRGSMAPGSVTRRPRCSTRVDPSAGCTSRPRGSLTSGRRTRMTTPSTRLGSTARSSPSHRSMRPNGSPLVGSGDMFVMFRDRPEVRALMQWFSTTDAVKDQVATGTFLAANNTVPAQWYASYPASGLAEIARTATALRYDGSDAMPRAVGNGSFWTGMVQWVTQNGEGTRDIFAEIEESWP